MKSSLRETMRYYDLSWTVMNINDPSNFYDIIFSLSHSSDWRVNFITVGSFALYTADYTLSVRIRYAYRA